MKWLKEGPYTPTVSELRLFSSTKVFLPLIVEVDYFPIIPSHMENKLWIKFLFQQQWLDIKVRLIQTVDKA